ncbi:MAG: LEA type 2 family protein [Spirochaetes bacterium]|nr:LEA type 2 family protein [Spirochaetota bacterium]MBU1081903.1 LEA type 2 family protein [Spirochaetota bacterium]
MRTGRGRSGARLLFAAVAAAAAALASCATDEPAPSTSVEVSVSSVSVAAVDLDTAGVTVEVGVVNTGASEVALSSLGLVASSYGEEIAAPASRDLGSERLAPGAAAAFSFRFEADAPEGDSPTIPFRVEARLAYSSPAGGPGESSIGRDCEFPRIMPPVMRISSIRIIKDELINTRLRLGLEVTNPNVFPLSFATLEYRLYGEGRYWASGSVPDSFEVPAGETVSANLYLTMNFTDMGRSLLDQVIKLAEVRYRLEGAGLVDTGLEFLPRFELPFDMTGRAGVSR